MKRKGLLLLGFISTITMFAAVNMVVVENVGTIHATEINAIRKITYTKDSLKIHFTDGSTSIYSLDAIDKITFGNEGVNTEIKNKVETGLKYKTYPNPFVDQINIKVLAKKNSKALVHIVDANGKNVFVGEPELHSGENHLNIALSHLKKGFYILCISQQNETENTIIIKK